MSSALDMFTSPREFTLGASSGFLLRPHAVGAEGWGEPFENAEGAPIVPGTLGGPNQKRLLGRKRGTLALTKSKNIQGAGNIDWVGPTPTAAERRRKVVTVNGPLSRHWNFGGAYAYDGNQQAHEIYKDGRCIGVAPFPVLGACLSPGRYRTPSTGEVEAVQWIIAVCKDGFSDVAYARPLGAGVIMSNLGDARAEMVKMFDPFTNPRGWLALGRQDRVTTGCDAEPPDSPWFFSSNGLTGKTVRAGVKEFDDGGGEELTNRVYFEISLAVTHTDNGPLVTFNSAGYTGEVNPAGGGYGAAPGFEYTETVEKTHPTYVSGADLGGTGVTHSWQEDWYVHRVGVTGSMLVAVDYDSTNSRWLYGSVHVFNDGLHAQYWTIGTDDPGHPRANTGNTEGPVYEQPNPYIPRRGDHYPTTWLGVTERTTFRVTANDQTLMTFFIGWGNTGSTSEKNGLPNNPADPFLAFWDSLDVWLHYVDMRHLLFSGYARADLMEISPSNSELVNYEELEWAGKNVEDPYESAADGERFMRFSSPVIAHGNSFGFTRAEMLEWPEAFEHEIERVSHDGKWSTANDARAIFEPAWLDFFLAGSPYRTAVNPGWRRWTVTDLLTDAGKNLRTGVFLCLADGTCLVSYDYQNQNTGEPDVANRLWPQQALATLVGIGNRYDPGGVV